MTADPTRLTVAVLTFRRPDDLSAVLPLLAEEVGRVVDRVDARILVVDNDPEGAARRQVEALAGELAGLADVRYAGEPEPGIAQARNRALLEAGDDRLLVFIDDDERPGAGWLAHLLDEFDRSGSSAVVGPVVSAFAVEPEPWVRAGRFFDRRRLPTGTPVTVAATNNLLLDLVAVRRLGLTFDPDVGQTGGEDTLFTRELVRRGGTMTWCDEAVVTDVVPPLRVTRSWVVRRAYSSGNGWSMVSLRLEGSAPRRLALRLRLSGAGLLRAAGGCARIALGILTVDLGQRARGVRTLARGAGMLSGAWGSRYREYRRTD